MASKWKWAKHDISHLIEKESKRKDKKGPTKPVRGEKEDCGLTLINARTKSNSQVPGRPKGDKSNEAARLKRVTG